MVTILQKFSLFVLSLFKKEYKIETKTINIYG